MNQGPLSCQRPCGFKPRDLVKIAHCRTVHMTFKSLCEFTGSDWGLWFSSRKCRLYKLGTQENLAPDLRKTPPYLNCIVLQLRYQTCWKPLQVTATLFLEPNIQPSVRFRIFRSNFSKMPSSLDVSSIHSRPGQPTKKSFQQMQGCKIMLIVCRWLLIDPSKIYTKESQKDAKFHKFWKRKMLFMTWCWKSWLLKGKSCRVVGVLQAIWTVRIENWYLAVPAWQAKKMQNGCKQAQTWGICNSCQDSRLRKKLGDWANTRTKKKNTNKRNKLPFLISAALKIVYRERNENKHTRDLIFQGLPHVEPPGVPFSKGPLGGERPTRVEKTHLICVETNACFVASPAHWFNKGNSRGDGWIDVVRQWQNPR